MSPRTLIVLLSVVVSSLCASNLVVDWDFEIAGANLPLTQNSSNEPFSYILLSSTPSSIDSRSVANWYSVMSGQVLIRQLRSMNTTMLDTLSNNYRQKICSNYSLVDSIPYELSFDYLIDGNVNFANLRVTWNGQQVIYKTVFNHYIETGIYTVYLQQSTNVLCFQGDTYENAPIGALIDNIVLRAQEVRYVHFIAVPSVQQLNFIQLISNLTVNQYSSSLTYTQLLALYRRSATLLIQNVMFRLDMITVTRAKYLCFKIQILQQYASSDSQPSITLPQHRNSQSQLITFVVTSDSLPRFIYSTTSDEQMVKQSRFYVLILTKIYNILFRIIKLVAFCFVGVRFLYFFYLYLFLMFLNIELILPTVRNLIHQIVLNTINTQTIAYFIKSLQLGSFDFGAQFLNFDQTFDNTDTSVLQYQTVNISPNIYSLVIDDLIIAILNTAKIIVIYYVICKSKPRFLKIMKEIKNAWIFIEYLPILSIVTLVASLCCRQGVPIANTYSKISRGISLILPMLAIFLSAAVFLRLDRIRKMKYINLFRNHKTKISNQNFKLNIFYDSQNYLSFIQNLMFFIIPALVGLGFVYLTLITLLIFAIIKLTFACLCLKNKPSFLYFFWTFSIIIQFFIISSFTISHLLTSISNLSSNSQIVWMSILKYNSVALLFMYMAGGFIEICCCTVNFIKGFYTLSLLCDRKQDNKVQNSYQQEIKIQQKVQAPSQASDIKVVNSIKDKIQKQSRKSSSLKDQISNPFIKSLKTLPKETQKQIVKDDKQQANQKQQQPKQKPRKQRKQDKKMTKIITLKLIQPVQQQIQGEGIKRARIKSEHHLVDSQESKNIVVKKPKELMKQKSFKLIKKLDISKVKDTQMSEGLQTIKNFAVSNFQKQQNFS